MCGIFSAILRGGNVAPILHGGIKRCEYRGYDSCGLATVDGNKLYVKKDSGKIDDVHIRLNFGDLPGHVGISHTRWSTHGEPSQINAHPHLSCDRKIAVVHNGIVSNYYELKEKLEKNNHKFLSETDTEVFAHLIEEYYNGDIEQALRLALHKIKGTYALAIVSTHSPDKIFLARNESPLVIGVGTNGMYAGSDITSFLDYTNKAVPLNDGEYAVLTKNEYIIKNIDSGSTVSREPTVITWTAEMAEKEGYEHFMLKEIHEQPRTIKEALNVYAEDIQKLARMINEAKRTYIIGVGTSFYSALVAEYWFSRISKVQVQSIDSCEFESKAVVEEGVLAIGITQSGETYDTLAAMRYAKRKGAKLAAIVNVIGSTATREASHIILQGSGLEIAVCATKTFTGQLTILFRTALELAKIRQAISNEEINELEEELNKVPVYIEKFLKEKGNLIKKVAEKECDVENYIFLSQGVNFPLALEGALKFKEITYLHAEGMPSGFLKHGTISLIDTNMHTIVLVPSSNSITYSKILSSIEEVKARGGKVIVMSADPIKKADANILVPKTSEFLAPFIYAPAVQLLAYYVAVKLDRDVDKPRHLAKSVTVE